MDKNTEDEIVKNLFLGGRQNIINTVNFDLVVNCTPDLLFFSNFKKIRIPVIDTPDDCEKLLEFVHKTHVIDEINDTLLNGGKVFVHCLQGIQRSCTVVAMYLIKYYSFTPEMAIEFIKRKRPMAFFGKPNFIGALRSYYILNCV